MVLHQLVGRSSLVAVASPPLTQQRTRLAPPPPPLAAVHLHLQCHPSTPPPHHSRVSPPWASWATSCAKWARWKPNSPPVEHLSGTTNRQSRIPRKCRPRRGVPVSTTRSGRPCAPPTRRPCEPPTRSVQRPRVAKVERWTLLHLTNRALAKD